MAEEKQLDNESRRDFLRTSAYAVYATPVILSMLVEKASACRSWGSNKEGDHTYTHTEDHRFRYTGDNRFR